MTDSAADFIAIVLGIGVFLVIVAVGWRSVQNRRILRLQAANGQETIIVAREDDDVSTVMTTTTETTPSDPPAAPSVAEENTPVAHPAPAAEFGRAAPKGQTAI